MPCFDECGCICGQPRGDFDEIVRAETKWPVTLTDIVNSHAGWYQDRVDDDGTIEGNPSFIKELKLGRVSGLYILWRQDGACKIHEREHLSAAYVGRSGEAVGARLQEHWARKQIGAGLATELSVWKGPNREGKYLEQLLLDIYAFPLNKMENPGQIPLCHHIQYAEWN